METVEIVIKMPKDKYDEVMNMKSILQDKPDLFRYGVAVANGTVLPKGHGDLVDKNILKEKAWKHIDDTESYSAVYLEDVEDARPVIEADKDGQDGR